MRHHNKNRKFGRVRKVRKALLNSLIRSLFLHGKIETTEAKARELRPLVEKIITKCKNPTVAVKRFVVAKIGPKASKLAIDISEKYKSKNGGYTRIVKSKTRISDGSKMAIIEFV